MARTRRGQDSTYDMYCSPLVMRNASRDMAVVFSPRRRAQTWRRIWLALAEAQHEMGLPVSQRQVKALRSCVDDIDFDAIARHEKALRHDVMAHLHAFGDAAPDARGVLHLGATSMDIVDNADLILMREAMEIVRQWLVGAIEGLAEQAKAHRALPCLGFTHFQPAQLTTVGKRIALWCYDFCRDLDEIDGRLKGLRFRGVRGATGTQASFLKLFEGKAQRVQQLERRVAEKLGFSSYEPVTGQTYSRKIDAQVLGALANIAAGVHKMANDIRLLAGLKEMEEPFGSKQVGSSAMAYKRNPMLSERATGLARFAMSLHQSALQNAAEQWLERTLDDSSNKRLLVPEMFLATDGMLQIVVRIARGLVVYPAVMRARIEAELPFMVSEDVLMAAAAGGDRQALHERIRVHAQAAAREVKEHGRPNDLLERLRSDAAFAKVDIDAMLKPEAYVGLAPQQVDRFLKDVVGPLLRRHADTPRREPEISV